MLSSEVKTNYYVTCNSKLCRRNLSCDRLKIHSVTVLCKSEGVVKPTKERAIKLCTNSSSQK